MDSSAVRSIPARSRRRGNESYRRATKLSLSQDTFAALPGVSPGTLRRWKQGRRQPSQAARVLLRLSVINPKSGNGGACGFC